MIIRTYQRNKTAIIIGAIALGLLVLLTRYNPHAIPRTALQSAKMNEHIQQNVQFFTQVTGSKASVKIYFAFSFKDKPFPLTISYQKAVSKEMQEFLVFHPQISLLTWPTLRENGLTLMQKTPQYLKITDFLAKPSGKVAIDHYIRGKYPNLKADIIDQIENFTADDYDFILTSHAPLKFANNTYYYENTIDASDASLDEYNQMTWLIRAPDADDKHVFYLSNIDVEFLSK